ARQRERLGRSADHARDLLPDAGTQLEHALEPRATATPSLLVKAGALVDRVERRLSKRSERAGIQVRVAPAHREQPAPPLVRHSTPRSTGAWSDRTRPPRVRRSTGQICGGPAGRPRTRMWSIPVGVAPEKPHSALMRSGSVRELRTLRLKS